MDEFFKKIEKRIYGRDRDGKIHHNAWLGADAQGVAANETDGSWRGHVELALCYLWR